MHVYNLCRYPVFKIIINRYNIIYTHIYIYIYYLFIEIYIYVCVYLFIAFEKSLSAIASFAHLSLSLGQKQCKKKHLNFANTTSQNPLCSPHGDHKILGGRERGNFLLRSEY